MFLQRKVWDDVWVRVSLGKTGDKSATAHWSDVDRIESACAHSHRLYLSTPRTVTTGTQKVLTEDAILFRRFLGKGVHEELQKHVRGLYINVAAKQNADAVWLALEGTVGDIQGGGPSMKRLGKKQDIKETWRLYSVQSTDEMAWHLVRRLLDYNGSGGA